MTIILENDSGPSFTYDITCVDKDGNTKWAESIHNLISTEGGNFLLDKFFKGSAYTAAWYMGLAGTGTKALTDTFGGMVAPTLAWVEVTPYDTTGGRPTVVFGSNAASKSNTATVVSYTINATQTVAGAFLTNVQTVPGTTGVLYSVADFSSARSVISGDTLNITATVSC
jgi:hypothetical protein